MLKWRRLLLVVLAAVGIAVGVKLYQQNKETSQPVAEVQQPPTLDVTHQLQGKTLSLNMKVTNFTFSLDHMGQQNKHGEGHVHLYIDGQKVAKIFEPTYSYAKMTPGKHEVTVELAHNDHSSYGVKKVFTIQVN